MDQKNEFFLRSYIISSHEDCDYYVNVEVGYNERFELVVRMSIDDSYEGIEYINEAYATRDAAYELSRRMKTPMVNLPAKLAQGCRTAHHAGDFPSARDINDSYREVLAMLDRYGCRYRFRSLEV